MDGTLWERERMVLPGEVRLELCLMDKLLFLWNEVTYNSWQKWTSVWLVFPFQFYDILGQWMNSAYLSQAHLFPPYSAFWVLPPCWGPVLSAHTIRGSGDQASASKTSLLRILSWVVHPKENLYLICAPLIYSTHPSAQYAIFEIPRKETMGVRNLRRAGQTQLYFGFFACLKNIFHCFEFDENVFSH